MEKGELRICLNSLVSYALECGKKHGIKEVFQQSFDQRTSGIESRKKEIQVLIDALSETGELKKEILVLQNKLLHEKQEEDDLESDYQRLVQEQLQHQRRCEELERLATKKGKLEHTIQQQAKEVEMVKKEILFLRQEVHPS